MRLFIGLTLPDALIDHLYHHIHLLGPAAPLRWTPKSNLHITLKFIGETKDENVSIFESVLRSLATKHKSFTLGCAGGGVFPSKKNPRVFWTGISGDTKALQALAHHIEEECEAHGFPQENRKFSPHLTLARTDQGGEYAEKFEKHFKTYVSPNFEVNRLHLIQSRLLPMGSEYTLLSSHDL